MVKRDEKDAVIAASKTHKILFENDKVRVLEVKIAPGEKEPLHRHPYKTITIIEKPATLRYFDENGKLISEIKAEGVSWIEPVELHSTQNVSATPFHGFRVELKGNSSS
jgi:quercetin dioxygenase-like cupin family protein